MGQLRQVTLSTELYSPRSKTDPRVRRESLKDAGGTSEDNYLVGGSSSGSAGGRAPGRILFFPTRGFVPDLPPGGEIPGCSQRISPREVERLSHVHMALLERREYWRICVTGLLSRCTAGLDGEQDGCDVAREGILLVSRGGLGGGSWTSHPPSHRILLMLLGVFLRPAYQQLSQHKISSPRLQDVKIPCLTTNPVSQQFVSLSPEMRLALTRSLSSPASHIQDGTQKLESNLNETKDRTKPYLPTRLLRRVGVGLPSPPTPPHSLIVGKMAHQ